MSDIIFISVLSVIVLLLTTHKVKSPDNKDKKNAKQHFFDQQAVLDVIQQLTIVFLSAMLAMWLTDYLETRTTREHVQSFLSPMQDSCISVFVDVDEKIKEYYKSEDSGQQGTDEQLYLIATEAIKNEATLFETMLYNENFISTLHPLSYTMLHHNLDTQSTVRQKLKGLDPDNLNRQETAELIAEYLFSLADAAFSMDCLREDVEFCLPLLAALDENTLHASIDNSPFFQLYRMDLEMLESLFDVDLSVWENYSRYNNTIG